MPLMKHIIFFASWMLWSIYANRKQGTCWRCRFLGILLNIGRNLLTLRKKTGPPERFFSLTKTTLRVTEFEISLRPNAISSLSGIKSLGIQSPCQRMIGVYNHLRKSKVFRFHETILRRWLDPQGMLTLPDALGKVNKFHLSKFLGPTDCLVKMMRIFWSPRKSKELCIFSMCYIFEKGSPFNRGPCACSMMALIFTTNPPKFGGFWSGFPFWISFYLDLLVQSVFLFRTSPVFVPTAYLHLRCVWDKRMPFAVFHLGVHEISQGAMYKMETSPGYIYIYVYIHIIYIPCTSNLHFLTGGI